MRAGAFRAATSGIGWILFALGIVVGVWLEALLLFGLASNLEDDSGSAPRALIAAVLALALPAAVVLARRVGQRRRDTADTLRLRVGAVSLATCAALLVILEALVLIVDGI